MCGVHLWKNAGFLCVCVFHCEIAIEIGFTAEIYDRIRRNFCVSNCVLLAIYGYSEPRVSDTIKLITQWELFHHSITFIAKNACIHIKRKTNRESIYMWMCGKKTANENRSTNISICTTIISYEHRVEKLNKIDLMLGWFTCVNPKENWL